MKEVLVPAAMLKKAVKALREVAKFNAAQSQQPDLYSAEETEEWKVAHELDTIIRNPDAHIITPGQRKAHNI
jgi:hypothetical protein